jgi:hypothetical protein
MSETKPKKMVSRNVALALGIICIVLVASRAGTIIVLNGINSQKTNLQNLLNATTIAILFHDLYNDEFEKVSLVSPSYNFSPPVSMYQALIIAFENGGWNETSLTNRKVGVGLYYMEFWNNTTVGEATLYAVTQPPINFYPVQVNDTTYRYVWEISNSHNPPQGWVTYFYEIDAATGEIVQHGGLPVDL